MPSGGNPGRARLLRATEAVCTFAHEKLHNLPTSSASTLSLTRTIDACKISAR